MASSLFSSAALNIPGLERLSEIEKRALLVDVLIRKYEGEGRRNPAVLREAIQQGELVQRGVLPSAAQRAQNLNRLSYAHMSEYVASHSHHALNEAVRCGRLARQEAVAGGIPTKDTSSYCDILNNLGVALSYRSHTNVQPVGGSGSTIDDLDQAIECAREAKGLTSPQRTEYNTSLANLASRLTHRYSKRGNAADQAEATRLLTELQSRTGQVPIQLVNLAVDKCNQTDTLEDLNEAIRISVAGLGNLPKGFEGRPEYFRQLATLYLARFKKTKNFEDADFAMLYSCEILTTVSTTHTVKGGYMLDHMRLVRDFAIATTNLGDVSHAIDNAKHFLDGMENGYKEQQSCRKFFGDLLGRRFMLSEKLQDLTEAVLYIQNLSYDYNEEVKKAGTQPPVDTSLIYNLNSQVKKLSSASLEDVKERAVRKIHEQISVTYKDGDFVNAILKIGWKFVRLLEVYANAANSGELISDVEAQRRGEELHRQKNAEVEQNRARPRWEPKTDYTTEFGVRSLAIDPTNGRIVLDLSGLMSNMLGYDVTKKMTEPEFAESELRVEQRSIEKVRVAGKRPNPNVCYMCRLIKPLCFSSVDIHGISTPQLQWNPKIFLPVGKCLQLKLRKKCSICRLILSLIVSDQARNTLHPHLAIIDSEIQGVSLHVGVSASGEEVLIVEYGMRPVGELRILRRDNAPYALRQAWEVDDMDEGEEEEEEGEEEENGLLPDNMTHQVPFKSATGQQIDLEALEYWLTECDDTHGRTCNSTYHGNVDSSRSAIDIPLIFIDVVDYRLIQFSTAARYFALSYVWGHVDMSPTTESNFEARCKVGGLPSKLPNTISDAMELVRSLGERYLWCDSLCIRQDSEEQKVREITNMDIVYSKAFATIVALHGTDANAGLPGIRPGTRPPQKIERLMLDSKSDDMDFTSDGKQVAVNIVATPTVLHLTLEGSRWDKRGWTFQERLLSRRCLYFSESYVYFQCGRLDAIRSETGVNEIVRSKDKYWDDPRKKPATTSLDNPLANLYSQIAELAPEARRAKSFAAYAKLVEQYTRRQLSHDTDIIDAFRGSLNVLKGVFPEDPLCGLPASMLDLALLWSPVARVPRRKGPGPGLQEEIAGRQAAPTLVPTNRNTVLAVYGPKDVQTFDHKIDRRFPSWSWTGWKGPVEYRLFSDAPPEEPLPTPLAREITINLDGSENRTVRMQAASSLQSTPNSVAGLTDQLNRASLGTNEVLPTASLKVPNTLQFLAPCVPLPTFTISEEVEYLSKADQIHAIGQQAVRRILDRQGKRCGLWWEQAGYVYVGRGVSAVAESKMLLVGISRHEDTFRRRTGPNRVEGEIKLFDGAVYPAVGQGSGLVNVLAVDSDMGHDYAERVTVARIHVKAWEDAAPVLKMVRLA